MPNHIIHRRSQFRSSNFFVLQLKDLYQISFPFYIQKTLCKKAAYNVLSLELYNPFDFQENNLFLCLDKRMCFRSIITCKNKFYLRKNYHLLLLHYFASFELLSVLLYFKWLVYQSLLVYYQNQFWSLNSLVLILLQNLLLLGY